MRQEVTYSPAKGTLTPLYASALTGGETYVSKEYKVKPHRWLARVFVLKC